MIKVAIVFDTKHRLNTFSDSWIFQKFISPVIDSKECLWFEIREVEEEEE